MKARTGTTVLLGVVLAGSLAHAGIPGTDLYLPSVARAAGAAGSSWFTTVWVHNPGSAVAQATVSLLQRGQSNVAPQQQTFTVGPGETLLMRDALLELFNASDVVGALRFECASQIVVSSRIFNDPGAGLAESQGQFFAAMPADLAITTGESTDIPGITQPADGSFRCNFGMVETAGQDAQVAATLFNPAGGQEAQKTYDLSPFMPMQVSLDDLQAGSAVDGGRLHVEVTSGSGRVLAFATIVGNGQVSQDPTTLEMEYDLPFSEANQYVGQSRPGLIPEVFAAGVVSTEWNEGPCAFTPDGREAVYHVVEERGGDLFVALVGTREQNGTWTEPEVLSFSGEFEDAYPFVSYDGSSLYFQSNRPSNDPTITTEYNIWYSRKDSDNSWSEPQIYRPVLDPYRSVSGISFALSGNVYYTLINGPQQAIYRSRYVEGVYLEPERLPDTVNSVTCQFDGVISPDESYMILGVYGAPDSYGEADLYVTFRDDDDNWSLVQNLGETFNSPFIDGPATITADGEYVFFAGHLDSPDGRSDVFWVSAEAVEALRPPGF